MFLLLCMIFNKRCFIVVLELAFLSAPRSMQGTAMGMVFLLTGMAYMVHFLIESTMHSYGIEFSVSTAKVYFWSAGFGGNLVSLVLLVLAHNKYDLGLSIV